MEYQYCQPKGQYVTKDAHRKNDFFKKFHVRKKNEITKYIVHRQIGKKRLIKQKTEPTNNIFKVGEFYINIAIAVFLMITTTGFLTHIIYMSI